MRCKENGNDRHEGGHDENRIEGIDVGPVHSGRHRRGGCGLPGKADNVPDTLRPGGGTDVAARTYAPYIESCLGTTVVIVNRPGAGGQIGFAELATSPPDGYMISTLNVPNVQVGAITGTAYTMDQFEFLGNIVGTNVTLTVGIDSPIETLDDLIEEARSRSTR